LRNCLNNIFSKLIYFSICKQYINIQEQIIINYIICLDNINILLTIDFVVRLIVGSGFGSNYRNRPDSTISTLGIDPKPKSISIILESIQLDPSRYSIPILGIESNCQEIENYVIMPRITNFRIFFY